MAYKTTDELIYEMFHYVNPEHQAIADRLVEEERRREYEILKKEFECAKEVKYDGG